MRLFELMNMNVPSVAKKTVCRIDEGSYPRIIRSASNATTTPLELEQLFQRAKSDPKFGL